MNRVLIRDDYYQMIIEILELERISVGHYVEYKYNEFKELNPHFLEILYKDINTVLDGILKDDEGDLMITDGDFAFGYDDFELTGPINNLHIAEIGLHQLLFQKAIEKSKYPNEISVFMQRLENKYLPVNNNTPEYNKKLKELNGRIKGWQNPQISTSKKNKTRIKIPKENKVRAELQKEIQSKCPFCDNDAVGHFEIHHIDEDPSNNAKTNLLLVCPTCHSKITKGDTTTESVESVKANLKNKNADVEFVSAVIDSNQCSWEGCDTQNCFFYANSNKSQFPILSFTVINHITKTLALKTVRLKVKCLESGISGFPKAEVLKSLCKLQIRINSDNAEILYDLIDPIQLPANYAAKFDIELYQKISQDQLVAPQGRLVLFFIFEFSNSINISIPKIHLNCKDEKEEVKIFRLS